jgi:hypothetical protein
MSVRSTPPAHCSCSVVPVQFSPPTEPRPLLLSISYWNSLSLARFTTAVHYIITVSRALILAFISREAKQLDTLVSSLEFHLAVPLISHATSHPHSATSWATLIHSYTHLEKIAHPFTWTRPSFSALFAPLQTQDSPAAATAACITDSNSRLHKLQSPQLLIPFTCVPNIYSSLPLPYLPFHL